MGLTCQPGPRRVVVVTVCDGHGLEQLGSALGPGLGRQDGCYLDLGIESDPRDTFSLTEKRVQDPGP